MVIAGRDPEELAARLTRFFFGAALFTLPWCGVGTLVLVTGRDWGFGLQPSWIFLYLAAACHGWALSRTGSGTAGRDTHLRTVVGSILLILGVVALSGVGLLVAPSAEPPSQAWGRFGRQTVQLAIMLGFLFFPAIWVRNSARWRFSLRWLGAGLVFQLLYSAVQQWGYYRWGGTPAWLESVFTSNPAILTGSADLYLGNTFHNVARLRGTMCEPLYLGSYLLVVLPWLWPGRGRSRRSWLLPGLGGLLLLLTWSRGAWLAAAAQGLALACFHRGGWLRRLPRSLVAGGVLVTAAALAAFLFSDLSIFQLPRDRLLQSFSTRDWSNLTRFYSMQAGWRAFLLSPVVGVGWGQFSFHFPLLVDPLGLQSQFSWPVVNNFFLKVLCETGVVGLGALLWLVWRLVRTALNRARDGGVVAWRVRTGLIALGGVALQLMTFSQYNLPHIWLAAGLVLAAGWDPEAVAAEPGGGS